MSYRIIVAHPGKQHSFRLATALEKSGDLYQYITTVYDKKSSGFTKIIKRFLGKRNRTRADGRKMADVPDEKVTQFCELRALFLLLLLRLDKSRKLFDWYNRRIANKFGKKVAKYAIKHNADAVVMYDSNAVSCFKYLKKKAPSIVRIMDNAAANRYTLFKLYEKMDEKYGILKDKAEFKVYLTDENKAKYFKEEAFLSDYHITASAFSKSTLTDLGIDESRIAVIPYGCAAKAQAEERQYAVDGRVKFLFVGEVSPQKGILQYVKAAEKLSGKAEFHLVGGGIGKLKMEIQQAIKTNIIYHGYLLQSELFKLYEESDVFVFPTLNDGFGMVVLEAMHFGLPVIASKNSVGLDIIADEKNGFCVEAGDEEGLVEKMQFFIDNPERIQELGSIAKATAQNYTWEEYDKGIVSSIQRMIGENSRGQ